MSSDLPFKINRTDGVWRCRPAGSTAAAELIDLLLDPDAAVPEGFRITAGAARPVGRRTRRIAADQTNESWVVDEAAVVKWHTEPLVGPHPGPARMHRLAAAGFGATPALWGMVEWHTSDGHWVPVATVESFLPGAEDGWTWCVREALVAIGVVHEQPWPFAAELGTLTAAMHTALVEGGGVLGHGDFHVGQLLRADDGPLFVIDFDGNPTLAPHERVVVRPAAYDAAGMLLSLENVAHVVHRRHSVSEEQALAWSDTTCEEFLAAYRAQAADLLDETLLPGLVLDQIQRELDYAENYLPRWRYVPEAALRRRRP